jgi:hypothetical protein
MLPASSRVRSRSVGTPARVPADARLAGRRERQHDLCLRRPPHEGCRAARVDRVDRQERPLQRRHNGGPAERDARAPASSRADRMGGDLQPCEQRNAAATRSAQGTTPCVLRRRVRRRWQLRADGVRPETRLLGDRASTSARGQRRRPSPRRSAHSTTSSSRCRDESCPPLDGGAHAARACRDG